MYKPAAVILAGGESRRMGRPKALLEIDGETFAQRLIRTFAEVCDPVILVSGAVSGIATPPAIEVHNPDWPLGQLSSLQAGLRFLVTEPRPSGSGQSNIGAVFFTPVDTPLFTAGTVKKLWETYCATPAPFVIPRLGDKRGHPVLADRTMIRELLALPPGGQARDVVHRYRGQTVYVDVADTGILADFDTPADYARLTVNS